MISLDDLARLPDSPQLQKLVRREMAVMSRVELLYVEYERALAEAPNAASISLAAYALASHELSRIPKEPMSVTRERREALRMSMRRVA